MQGYDGSEANAVIKERTCIPRRLGPDRGSAAAAKKKEEMSAGAYRGKAKAGSGRDGSGAAALIGAR